MTDPKIDYLETIHQQQDAVNRLISAAAIVRLGGVEGLQQVVATQPEAILSAIEGLAVVVHQQQTQIRELVEEYLETLDQIEKINQK